MEENKVRTKTEEFKVTLQEKVSNVIGCKVSKQKAWELFKELVKTPFAFILDNYNTAGRPTIAYGEKHKELELPLSGIGTFKVITVGQAENVSVKGRWYLSSALDNDIKEALGFAKAAVPAGEVLDSLGETETVLDINANNADAVPNNSDLIDLDL